MNNMKRIILTTVTLVVLSACSKYVQPSVLSEYEGTYEIESIIWRGSIDIDINHDGVKEADWISEFNGSPGYVKTWGKGEVFISSDNSLRITSTIPIFVTTRLGDGIYTSGICYYGLEHNTIYHQGGSVSPSFATNLFQASNNEAVYGLNDCGIFITAKDTYELFAHCSIINPDDSSIIEDTVHYTFKKIKPNNR